MGGWPYGGAHSGPAAHRRARAPFARRPQVAFRLGPPRGAGMNIEKPAGFRLLWKPSNVLGRLAKVISVYHRPIESDDEKDLKRQPQRPQVPPKGARELGVEVGGEGVFGGL